MNDRGVFKKYHVSRVDGRDEHPTDDKHRNCFLFVLDIDHDPFARAAARAYANACRDSYPTLAVELTMAVDDAERADS